MDLRIDTLVLGPLETNCYVLRSDEDCWVVDPAMDAGPLLDLLAGQNVRPGKVLLTHGHGDHISGIGPLKAAFPAIEIVCPAEDAEMLGDAEANMSAAFGVPLTVGPPDELVRPGLTLTLGRSPWSVLDTSGHTRGGVSYYCPAEKVVLTGDALFAGSIGRTDVPGASAARLLANVRTNLLSLSDDVRVLPGHGPATTIGSERAENPFFAG